MYSQVFQIFGRQIFGRRREYNDQSVDDDPSEEEDEDEEHGKKIQISMQTLSGAVDYRQEHTFPTEAQQVTGNESMKFSDVASMPSDQQTCRYSLTRTLMLD